MFYSVCLPPTIHSAGSNKFAPPRRRVADIREAFWLVEIDMQFYCHQWAAYRRTGVFPQIERQGCGRNDLYHSMAYAIIETRITAGLSLEMSVKNPELSACHDCHFDKEVRLRLSCYVEWLMKSVIYPMRRQARKYFFLQIDKHIIDDILFIF